MQQELIQHMWTLQEHQGFGELEGSGGEDQTQIYAICCRLPNYLIVALFTIKIEKVGLASLVSYYAGCRTDKSGAVMNHGGCLQLASAMQSIPIRNFILFNTMAISDRGGDTRS
jgi:hypothetical protein